MNVSDAIVARKSVRQFLDKAVDKELIKDILNIAKWAPSGTNTQPWEVYVLQGQQKQALDKELISCFESGEPAAMEYHYYPEEWHQPYQSRRRECGLAMYSALNITRQDKERRQQQWALNYSAFNAPVVLFFTIDKSLENGSYFDYGMFYQSLMLAAVDQGLATCPQAALAEYPKTVKKALGIPDNKILLCGLALGYEDTAAPVNNYRTSRIELDEFVTFVE